MSGEDAGASSAAPARATMRLRVLGAHSLILTELCAACPFAEAGCCRAPPRIDWSDIGRIVSLGGRDWLLGEVAAGRLKRIARGLIYTRRKVRLRADGARDYACVYLAPGGCTLAPDKRAATCNYYACEESFARGGAEGEAGRALHAALVEAYTRWDEQLDAAVRALHPEGPSYDATFFDWLGARFDELVAASPPAVAGRT